MTAIQELQAIEALLKYFSPKSNNLFTQQQTFKAVFSGFDASKLELLHKLISMSIGLGAGNVLNVAAAWMQVC